MNIIMYPHGGSGNRGCEAIVRATNKILIPDNSILFSSAKNEDYDVGLNNICSILDEQKKINKYSLKFIIAYIQYHFLHKKDAFDLLIFRNIFKNCNKQTLALSIGGDNYCYGEAEFIYLINSELRRRGIKTVLWGCSVDENLLSEKMINDLKGYELIVARESITYEAMKKINPNTVLYPDPAFQLDTIELPLPNGFMEGNTVGINVSPMIIDNEENKGITLRNYECLIEYIINQTDMQIALIAHVIWDFNDDREPINYLYEKYKETKRVVKIPAVGSQEIKGYISRCRFFIGARTHSTIAAYSTCVPTLVVGYSVKARGIAKDIFGTYENYVLSVQSLSSTNQLKDAFIFLLTNEFKIKEHLENVMPNYCKKVLDLRKVIEQL